MMMTAPTITARPVPSPERSIASEQSLGGCGGGLATARPTYEPILRASQARGLCALMDELRGLGALRANQSAQGCESFRVEPAPHSRHY